MNENYSIILIINYQIVYKMLRSSNWTSGYTPPPLLKKYSVSFFVLICKFIMVVSSAKVDPSYNTWIFCKGDPVGPVFGDTWGPLSRRPGVLHSRGVQCHIISSLSSFLFLRIWSCNCPLLCRKRKLFPCAPAVLIVLLVLSNNLCGAIYK